MRRTIRRLKSNARRLMGEPFGRHRVRPQLIHVAHHRAGTLWFTQVLRHIAETFGLSAATVDLGSPRSDAEVVVLWSPASMFIPERPWRGSHMIRDPRDMIVSGYHYHLWSEEPWLHGPRESLGGQTYQEALNTLDPAGGLALEIENFAMFIAPEMANWDYSRPEILEMRYEDVLADEPGQFGRLFEHYGFSERACRVGLEVSALHSLALVGTQEGTHRRSGKPGQWKIAFTDDHVALFKQLTGDLLVRLGYEQDDSW